MNPWEIVALGWFGVNIGLLIASWLLSRPTKHVALQDDADLCNAA